MKSSFFAVMLLSAGASLSMGKDVNTTTTTEMDYSGYQLVRLYPHNEEQLAYVKSLQELISTTHSHTSLDLWKESKRVGEPVDLLVSPAAKQRIYPLLRQQRLTPLVQIADMGRAMQSEKTLNALREGSSAFARLRSGGEFDFDNYHPHSAIIDYLKKISAENSNFVTLGSIGRSYEGRELAYVKIGVPHDGSGKNKSAVFIDAGIHAREWIAPASALHLINRLLTDKSLLPLLEKIDIYVLPSLNPDGYEYTRQVDRFWRKTRTPPKQHDENSTTTVQEKNKKGYECYGVDPNRNFPYHWDEHGTSRETCSEIYSGPKALSEIECQALAKFLEENKGDIKAYLSLHAYGNLLMHSYGYAYGAYPDDVQDQLRVAKKMAAAVVATGGPAFTVGSTADVLYEPAGNSQDFAKSLGIKYAYTMELTNTNYGFAYPARLIRGIALPAVTGLLVLAEEVGQMADYDRLREPFKQSG